MPDNVARSIMGALGEGNKQHGDFVAHHLPSTAVAFHAPIKMNKIHLPGNRHKYRNKSKHVNSTKEYIFNSMPTTLCNDKESFAKKTQRKSYPGGVSSLNCIHTDGDAI